MIHEILSATLDGSAVAAAGEVAHHVTAVAHHIVGGIDVPQPVDPGDKMPGKNKIGEGIWVARFVGIGVVVLGGVGAGARMAVNYGRGEAMANLGALGWVCVGAFVVGLIFSIVSGAAN